MMFIKYSNCQLFFFILLSFSTTVKADFFNCKKISIEDNLWESHDICYETPLVKGNVYVLNSKTNTPVNKEMLFAFYEDTTLRRLMTQSSAYQTERYSMIKLEERDLSKKTDIGDFFSDEVKLLKNFLQWHEMGHVWYSEFFVLQNKMIKESFSDVVGVLLLESNNQNFLKKLKEYRRKTAYSNNSLDYYTVPALREINSFENNEKDIESVLSNAHKIVKSIKEQDVLAGVRKELLKDVNRCDRKRDCAFYFYLLGLIFDKPQYLEMTLSEFKTEVLDLPSLKWKDVSKDQERDLLTLYKTIKKKQ